MPRFLIDVQRTLTLTGTVAVTADTLAAAYAQVQHLLEVSPELMAGTLELADDLCDEWEIERSETVLAPECPECAADEAD